MKSWRRSEEKMCALETNQGKGAPIMCYSSATSPLYVSCAAAAVAAEKVRCGCRAREIAALSLPFSVRGVCESERRAGAPEVLEVKGGLLELLRAVVHETVRVRAGGTLQL